MMVAGTVCFSVLASGAVMAIVVIIEPTTDIGVWVTRITGVMTTMIGLMAGFLAGRTDTKQASEEEPPSQGPEG